MTDAVLVLGGGPEGLAAAATLAAAGRAVTLLEEGPALGGAHAPRPLGPAGEPAPGVPLELGGLVQPLLAPLALERHGLRFEPAPRVVHAPASGEEGAPLVPGRELEGPAAAWLARVRPFLASVLAGPPPALTRPSLGETLEALRTGWRLRRLGTSDVHALLRSVPQSAADWAGEVLARESDRVAAVAPALVGSVLGPLAPGTAGLALLRLAARGPEPVGGGPALVDALAAAARASGAELRTGTPLAGIELEKGRVRGVRLGSGERLEAAAVLSTLAPARTWLELLPPRAVPKSVERAARHWRARSDGWLLELAVSRAPAPRAEGGLPVRSFVTAGTLLEVERAMDDWKHGRVPERPVLHVELPAPGAAGGHVRALVRGVPFLDGAAIDDARPALRERVLERLEAWLPGLGASVVAERLSPWPAGHPFDGELALDQLWIRRPSPELSRHAGPLQGLFLGGAAAHPGGPFVGGAGVLAARALLSA